MDQRPIGVFDSGSGGLTAVREIRSILPSENIIYFGDTSRVPYGGRSADMEENGLRFRYEEYVPVKGE